MKICVVQTRPIRGDVQGNKEAHKKWIATTVTHHANLIIFPELSLTGYEPTLAAACAIEEDDAQLDDFQEISNGRQITIGVGMPTKNRVGICISMILFQPQQPRQTYSKRYLHVDEEEFFVSGSNFPIFKMNGTNIAPAICYELSVPAHAQQAHDNGADIYIASVAKSASGVQKAAERLADIARHYALPVLLCNCVGPSDNFEGAGQTAVWNAQGHLLCQLNDAEEGIIIYDTATERVMASMNGDKID